MNSEDFLVWAADQGLDAQGLVEVTFDLHTVRPGQPLYMRVTELARDVAGQPTGFHNVRFVPCRALPGAPPPAPAGEPGPAVQWATMGQSDDD